MSDVVIRVENVSKLYRLGEVGTGSLAHDVNRWWHRVRGKEDPYLKIVEVNDRTKPAARAVASSELRVAGEEPEVAGKELLVTSENQSASGPATRNQSRATASETPPPLATAPQGGAPATSYPPPVSPKAPPSDWVYALKDVSFEVKRGEVLGIIGRNGAGKSTLLKILSRVTTQSSGQIKVKGRIASLLEVGTGFHPELTGRENIFLNGAILGMRKAEIARKFDEIVEFSGCARYIDTPVKRYSSGMYVRLAFAVAAHLEPEILIVDEVLAVGDAEFQKKCLGKMKDVAGHGRTILFVSHNMVAVQNLCTRGCLFHNGTIVYQGDINSVVSKYAALHQSLVPEIRTKLPNQVIAASRDGNIRLTKFEFIDDAGNAIASPRCGDNVTFSIAVQMTTELKNATLLISVNDQFGTRITQLNSEFAGTLIHLKEGNNSIACRVENFPLSPMDYSLDLKILNKNECLLLAEGFSSLNVQVGDFYGTGKMPDTQWSGFVQIQQSWRN